MCKPLETTRNSFALLLKVDSALRKRFAGSFAPATRLGLSVRDLVLRAAASFLPLGKWLIRKMVGDQFAPPDYSL